jgi:hypothetical protein
MYIYCSDEMATKGSNLSKYQSTICSLLDLSSLAISTYVIVPTPYSCDSLYQEQYFSSNPTERTKLFFDFLLVTHPTTNPLPHW